MIYIVTVTSSTSFVHELDIFMSMNESHPIALVMLLKKSRNYCFIVIFTNIIFIICPVILFRPDALSVLTLVHLRAP